MAVEGTTITLSKSLEEGYVFNNWVVMQGETPITVENDQFEMPAGDVTVTAVLQTLPRYAITVTPNEHGTVRVNNAETPDENGYLEDALITLIAQGNEGWTLAENGYTITPSDPTVTVEIQPGVYGSYYFYMPACNVTISSTFRELEQYTVTYHINGVESQETVYEEQYFNPSQPTLPAGTEWYSWVTEDLEGTYTTTQPGNKFNGGEITSDMDLYAVFKFTETVPVEGATTWEKVSPDYELKNGDNVIIVSDSYSYYYTLINRASSDAVVFKSSSSISSENLQNGYFDANTIIFTINKEGSNCTFTYDDVFAGTTTLARNDYNLVPATMGGDDTWIIPSGYICAEDYSHYIYFSYSNKTFSFDGNSPAYIYKEVKPTQTNYYYMTSVLGIGEADVHIAADIEVPNVVIANNAKLTIDNGATLDVAGICLSAKHDAAQLVVEDGGQLVHNNAGTVATMKKNITGYTGTNDHYYLIANPTDETTVANLTNNNYDLYTFDPTEALEWRNMKEEGTTDVENEKGYLYANSADVTLQFAGKLTPAGETNVNLTYAVAGTGIDFPGFNLIGNPYACNAYIEGYNFYKMVNGELQPAVTSATIAPCEGFFVEATETGQSVTLNTTAPEAPASLLNITVSQNRGDVIDRAIVNFNDNNDLHKFMMNPAHTNLSIAKGGETFAAISTEAEGELPVNFKAEKDGTYTITVNTENVEANYLHLIDNLTGMDTDLLSTPSYTFNATTSDYASRFKLVFSMNNNEDMSQANSFAYINNGEIIISNEGRATLQVIDVMGRIISSEEIHGECRISTNGLTAGLYILNLNGMTQKIVVR